MDTLCVAIVALLCVVSSSQDGISGSEVEIRVTPGDNVTLYCDSTVSTGVYIIWFRNCSHEHQPTLVINTQKLIKGYMYDDDILSILFRFKLQWNPSNNTYDLLIENITESDLGLYYCGTLEKTVEDFKLIEEKKLYRYGNVTRKLFMDIHQCEPADLPDWFISADCGLSWVLVVASRTLFLILIPAAFFIGNSHGACKERRKIQKRRDKSFSISVMN